MPTLANESALGLYVFSWTFDGMRAAVMFGPGLNPPLATLASPSGEIVRPVTDPERFGYQPGMKLAGAKRFAQAYADALEGSDEADADAG